MLLVYIDNNLVIGDDEKERSVLKECLTKEFELKEFRKLKYFLGIKVAHPKARIFIS